MRDMAGTGCRVGRNRRGRAAASRRAQIGIGNQLERNLAFQPRIQGAIHFAHSARADPLDQAVRTKLCSFCDRHRIWLRWKIVSLGGSSLTVAEYIAVVPEKVTPLKVSRVSGKPYPAG